LVFNHHPANVDCALLFVFLDFETTGLDVLRDSIVEIGAVAAGGSEVFSTVVRPPALPTGIGVHGIPNEELLSGPAFPVAFVRLAQFLDHLSVTSVDIPSDSEEDTPLSCFVDAPKVVLCAHNGHRFDFAMLASETLRCGAGWLHMERWGYVDTLEVMRSVEFAGLGCVKLQCLLTAFPEGNGLRAHRALDDALGLMHIIDSVALRLGVAMRALLGPFVVDFDAATSISNISCLLGE
jgi:DNA polymerase III epsilon subunit-like protein